MKRAGQLGCLLLVVLFLLSLLVPLGDAGRSFFVHLFTGGFSHFRTSLPHLLPGLPALFGFVLLLGATLWLLQALLKRMVKTARGEPREWRPKWTFGFVAMLLAAFGTACTTIGLVHHTVWLLRNDIVYLDAPGRYPNDFNIGTRLVSALQSYASDHQGAYPENLTALVREGILRRGELTRLSQMRTVDGLGVPWNYLPGLITSDPADLLLIAGQLPTRTNVYIVYRNDGSADALPRAEYDKALAAHARFVASKRPKQ